MDSNQTCFGTCIRQKVEITSGNWYSALLKLSKCGHFPNKFATHICTQPCKHIFLILSALPAETFVTSVATSLAKVVTLTATFSPPAICGLCFIIYTKADSATFSILLHPTPIATSQTTDIQPQPFCNILIHLWAFFLFQGNNSVTFTLPYHHIIVGVVAQSLEVVGEILPRKNDRGNSLGLSTPWRLP